MEFIFTVEHSLTDGAGAAHFLKEWILFVYEKKSLSFVNSEYLLQTGSMIKSSKLVAWKHKCYTWAKSKKHHHFVSEEETSEMEPIPPSADHFYPIFPTILMLFFSVFLFLKKLKCTLLPLQALHSTKENTPETDSPYPKVKFHSVVVEEGLSEEDTEKLLKKCKLEGSTVGNAIYTALTVVTSKKIVEKVPKARSKHIYTAVNVDLRRMASSMIPADQSKSGLGIGFYGGFTFLNTHSISETLPVAEDSSLFWNASMKAQKEHSKKFSKGEHLYISQVVGHPKSISIIDQLYDSYLKDQSKTVYPPLSFLLSNLGDISANGGTKNSGLTNRPTLFSEEEMSFLPAIEGVHAAVTSSLPDTNALVGSFTFKKQLKLFVVFSGASFNREGAVDYLNSCKQTLLTAIE